MRVLFLGGNSARELADWLDSQSESVLFVEHKIELDFIRELYLDMIVSYNYKYMLPPEIVEYPEKGCINLHISLLPWNRGYHPNVWSILEETPKGVTIHCIDEGIDTGDIIVQQKVFIDETKETLKSSYEILQREIQALFKENWYKIKKDDFVTQPQIGQGSLHFKREFPKFEPFIREKGWDTPIRELKGHYNKRNSKV